MKYPVWFPHPQCWLRALLIFASLLPTWFVWWIFGPLVQVPGLLELSHTTFAVDWLLFWLPFLFVFTPITSNAFIDRWVWNRPTPQQKLLRSFPRLSSWLEAIYSWWAFCSSLVVVALLDIVTTGGYQYMDSDEVVRRWPWLALVVMVLCAYWLQLRHNFQGEIADLKVRWANRESRLHRWLGQKPKRAQRTTTKPPKPKPPADSIDAELEELRRRMEDRG